MNWKQTSVKEVHREARRRMRAAAATGVNENTARIIQKHFKIIDPVLTKISMVYCSVLFASCSESGSSISVGNPEKSEYTEVRAYRPMSLLIHL